MILGRDDIRLTPFEEQADLVREAFGRQRTLLIVDNLETMEDKQGILSFLYELTSTVKVVLTTRERAIYTPIRLEQLAEDATIELIEQQAEEKQVSLSQKEVQMLYKRIGGIPAALVYAVGQRAAGYSMESILRMVPSADGDVARFCFQGSVEPLRGKKAHEMLMAFALFPRMPSRAAVTYVAGLETDPIEAEEALSQLQRLSLIRELDDRFRMLPLTREYALAELRAHPDFEKKAHERWVTWYLRFAQNYGGHDMEDWYKRFDPLNEEWENLQALFDWCAVHDRYDVLKVFWCAEEPGSIIDFTTLYGHWDNRLDWLNWLIDAAEGREDWLTWLDATASKAITLALMTRHAEAEKCFEEGEQYLSYAQPHIKVHWLINKVYPSVFKIGPKNREKINTQEYFDKALALLDQARDIVPHVPDAQLRTRFTLNINYNYASAFYWRGETAIAKGTFQKVMEEANTFGWQWLANGAQNYLGDIARNEGDYDTAERLLELGLRIAERNNEKRRTAKYKSSLAYLRQKQGRRDEALEWARMAYSDFSRIKVLGVDLEIKRMESLINTLESNRSH
ncbi:hypothetical protein KDAU_52140 [Dictyobacter aurantiacus]|uniref:NB-ARC domain-containing protein n=1 Tax=Dictyobacter aurantiacus TaxID=1936993 RepID=A0A401ZM03_9CHLR|nr:hypothetical protein KDAU_52140 [Dictyobacter aurantiacus]